MARRPILILPDSRLRQAAARVPEVTDEIRSLADDMLETMYAAPGIGLAGPQIGAMQRIIVMDVAKRQDESAKPAPMVLINPEITWSSEEKSVYEEGCLSIPDFYEVVERPAVVHVTFLDRAGKPQKIEAEGILATCVQHEIDHLDGVLFIDHISRLKRSRVVKKFDKAAAQREAEDEPRRAAR